MKKTIYVLSGLGADSRAFKDWQISGYHIQHIRWLEAEKNEDIGSYALRLSKQIVEVNPIIMGLSFGGIMAQELTKILNVEQLILLASIKNRDELPFYYKVLGKLNLYQWVNFSRSKKWNKVISYFFGVQTEEDRLVLQQILEDTDTTFLRWAFRQVANWKGVVTKNKVYHIHGSEDKILPLRFLKPDKVILGAGHLLSLTHSDEVIDSILEFLDSGDR